eukprot:1157556-Pelagomonas_calceolata.AAC.13
MSTMHPCYEPLTTNNRSLFVPCTPAMILTTQLALTRRSTVCTDRSPPWQVKLQMSWRDSSQTLKRKGDQVSELSVHVSRGEAVAAP